MMAHEQPQVLMLATDWPDILEATTETLTINQSLARDLSRRDAKVFCTVPHFHHLLEADDHKSKLDHARKGGVKLIGAVHRNGRRENPDKTWITDYWRQYYHDDVRYNGANGIFTHIIAYVPDTYHSALDIAEEYKEDGGQVKVVLIVTDTDHMKDSLKDEEILQADEVYVVGPRLLSEYHDGIDPQCRRLKRLMPVIHSEAPLATDAAQLTNPLLDKDVDVRIVTMWPTYTSIAAERDTSGLDEVAKAINGFSKYRHQAYHQKVRWEIRGVPDDLQHAVRNIIITVVENSDVIDVNGRRDIFVAKNYTLYVSALRKHPCDIYCLQAMQHGVPALLYDQSGLGEYLKKNDALGNQLVGNFLVDCDIYRRDGLIKWALAFDKIRSIDGAETREFVESARRLAEGLAAAPDPSWQGLVSSIVSDAAVCHPGTAHVFFENPGTRFQSNDVSRATHSGPGESDLSGMSSVNAVAIQDQGKALSGLSLKSHMAIQATASEPVVSHSWDEIFSERSLALLSMKLSKEMELLGKCLGLKQHDIDRFLADHPHNTAGAVSAMLVHYKVSSKLYKSRQQIMEFVKALVDVNRRDLVEEVAGPQPEFPVPTPAAPRALPDTTDLTRRRVKLWQDDIRFQSLLNDQAVYRSRGTRPHGFAVVVNIKHVKSPVKNIPPREGSEVDVAMIENVFRQLHYRVLTFNDPSAQALMEELRHIAAMNEELRSHDSMFVFLMSHGLKDKIYCSDGKTVELRDIFRIFDEDCVALRGKPKFFVIQACRNDTQEVTPSNSLATDGPGPGPGWKYTVPDNTYDTLFAFSTVDGTKSFRDTQFGSWYIKAVAEKFCEHAQNDHVLDIFTKVNQHIRLMTQETTQMVRDERSGRLYYPVQCAEIQTRLTKQFYLFPGKL